MEFLYQSPIGVLQISSEEDTITQIKYFEETQISGDKVPVVFKNCINQLEHKALDIYSHVDSYKLWTKSGMDDR